MGRPTENEDILRLGHYYGIKPIDVVPCLIEAAIRLIPEAARKAPLAELQRIALEDRIAKFAPSAAEAMRLREVLQYAKLRDSVIKK